MEESDVEVEVVSPSPPPLQGHITRATSARTQVAQALRAIRDIVEVSSEPDNMEDENTDVEVEEESSREDTSDVELVSLEGDEVVLDTNSDEVIVQDVVEEEVIVDGEAEVPSRPSTPLPPSDEPAVVIQSSPEATDDAPRIPDPISAANPPVDVNRVPESPSNSTRPVIQRSPARTVSNLRNSQSDFRSPKRRKLSSPAKPPPPCDEEEDFDSCPICFEPWTNSGNHRLASLRCGHLFGQSCIEKWLRGQGGKCPHCNAKAKRLDIRVIYAKSLKTLDTTERDRALKDAENERSLRKKAELATAQARLHYQLAVEECNRLKSELDRCKKQLQNFRSSPLHMGSNSSQSSQETQGQFKTGRLIKILEDGGCRVLSYCPSLATLIISQPSTSSLFPGHGVKKLSAMDFRTTQFVTVHSKMIRCLSLHPESGDGLLLSGAMDKTVKLTSLHSNTVVQTYNTPMPVWSCVWNTEDKNYFFAGQQNGTVLEFDVRNTQEQVQELNTEGTRAPVVSLQYVPSDLQAMFRPGGLLVGQLDRLTFYEKKPDEFKLHLLPSDGNLTSLYFEPKTRHILTSFRPSTVYPTVRHVLSEMTCTNISTDPTEVETLCSSNAIQTFYGGRVQKNLSKTTLIPCPTNPSKVLTCAGDETSSKVHVWDSSDGHLLQKLPAGGAVIDMCPLEVNNQHYLATLTGKSVSMHQWLS